MHKILPLQYLFIQFTRQHNGNKVHLHNDYLYQTVTYNLIKQNYNSQLSALVLAAFFADAERSLAVLFFAAERACFESALKKQYWWVLSLMLLLLLPILFWKLSHATVPFRYLEADSLDW